MTPESQELLELARTVVEAHRTISSLAASMISGSSALGISDQYSDVDMMLYYYEMPTEANLDEARGRLGNPPIVWTIGNPEDGEFMQALKLRGVEVQIVHGNLEHIKKEMDDFFQNLDVASPYQKALSGTLQAIPLYGEEVIGMLKEKASKYPEELAVKMVQANLDFFPVWSYYPVLKLRDAGPWTVAMISESVAKILAVLSGLNRVYFTTFQLKHTSELIDRFIRKPNDLHGRIERVLFAPTEIGMTELASLVVEVRDLVAEHMPEIDLTRIDKALNRKFEPWK